MTKNITTNPIKLSQPAGAALAFMGIKGSVPLWYGSQGCTAFGKVLFIQHFREPVPFQTAALNQTDVIMGGDGNLIEAVDNLREDAEFIGILTTGVTETNGADMDGVLKTIRERPPDIKITSVNTQDFEGSLETGYAKACEAVIKSLVGPRSAPRRRQVAVLPGPYVTPGEVEYLRGLMERFNLRPVFFPDLGDSLYGYLPDAEFIPCSPGGIGVDEVETLADSTFVISIGRSMRACAALLAEKGGITAYHYNSLASLKEIDSFFEMLEERSGLSVPNIIRRMRSHLQDTLLDTQFDFHGKKAGIAGDPDFIMRWMEPLADVGGAVSAVSSLTVDLDRGLSLFTDEAERSRRIGTVPVEAGDLRDLESLARENELDLLIGNSHVAKLAADMGVQGVRSGIPVYDRLGEAQSVRIGYDGLARLYMECANAMMSCPNREAKPYVSKLQMGLKLTPPNLPLD